MTNDDKTVEECIDNKDVVVGVVALVMMISLNGQKWYKIC